MRHSHHSRDPEHRGCHAHAGHGHHFGPRGHGRHGFGRGGWQDGEEREGRHGRRRRIFDSGELRLVLLKLIADQPRHGYELIRAIEELTGGAYVPSPGVVYPTLTLLQDVGEIEEAAAAPSGATSARKPFAITAQGTAELEQKKEEVAALLKRLADLATQRERSDGGPVRRAMGNLKAVLINRLERGEMANTMLHDIADIIDEAARKIERLENKN